MSEPLLAGGESGQRYGYLTGPLEQRGVECTVEWGLSDYYVRAQLPDGHTLLISPPQETAAAHPPASWLVTLHTDDEDFVRVVYDSAKGGPEHGNAGDVGALLAALDQLLDRHALPQRTPARPDAAFADHPWHGILAATGDPDRGARAILDAHGWLPVPRYDVYRLPLGTGRTEALKRVATTITALHRAGLTVAVEPAIARESASRRRLDPGTPSVLPARMPSRPGSPPGSARRPHRP